MTSLIKEAPTSNVYFLQGFTKIPYSTYVFNQCGIKTKGVSVKKNKGKISGEWITPTNPVEGKVMLYIHGGAFLVQNAAAARFQTSLYAKYFNWKTFSTNYGHPPKQDYNSIMDGLLLTWDWLLEQGVKPQDIVFAGDSAGGNLAISLSLYVTYKRSQKPAGLLLFSPWVNMHPYNSESFKNNFKYDYLGNRNLFQFAVDLYVNDNDPDNPLLSLYRLSHTELRELPPLYCATGKAEMLNWSIKRFFEKTQEAKGQAQAVRDEFYEAAGMPHVYPLFTCTQPAPDVQFVPCLCRLNPCCLFGHCRTTDPEKALKHPTWATLDGMKRFLDKLSKPGAIGA